MQLSSSKKQNNISSSTYQLGLTEQFSKALDKEGKCFEYLCNNFPGISKEKKKMEIFDAPDIGKFLKDPHFIESINNVESRA